MSYRNAKALRDQIADATRFQLLGQQINNLASQLGQLADGFVAVHAAQSDAADKDELANDRDAVLDGLAATLAKLPTPQRSLLKAALTRVASKL